MRTTITLDDALIVEIKTSAAHTARTMNQVITDAIRLGLAKSAEARRAPVKLPVFHGGGTLQPGVDLDSNAALLDLMDGPEP
jgi:antitoxin component of RelBE/YafQ-DinJ toxin-antitoxin module